MGEKNRKIVVREIWQKAEDIPSDIPRDGLYILPTLPKQSESDTPADTEEDIFVFLQALAESFPTSRIIVALKWTAHDNDLEAFVKGKLRGILRAAVFGSFSLLVEGINTQNEYSLFCKIFSETFCELEEEKREFNGYIEKGIMISTPLGALSAAKEQADFLCILIDELTALMCGKSISQITGIDQTELSELAEIISKILDNTKVPLLCLTHTTSPITAALSNLCNLHEIWITRVDFVDKYSFS